MTWGFMNVSRSSSNILKWRKEWGFHDVAAKLFKWTGRTWDGVKCFFIHAANMIKPNHFIGILCFINRKKIINHFQRMQHLTKTLKLYQDVENLANNTCFTEEIFGIPFPDLKSIGRFQNRANVGMHLFENFHFASFLLNLKDILFNFCLFISEHSISIDEMT